MNMISTAALVCILLNVYTLVTGSSIDVVPAENQFVAVNSQDNVTFRCDVRGPGGTANGREAVWEVQRRQIQNDPDDDVNILFSGIGIFVEVVDPGVTDLIITSRGRQNYLDETPPNPNITVRCASFVFPVGDVGQELTVTTFDIPSVPLELSLNPDPADVTELVFSWVIPEGSLAGVPLTYSPASTGPFNIANVTTATSVIFSDDASLDCQPHTFSVLASNAAGDGLVASINETIPISPDITAINSLYEVTQVSLADPVTITISVPLAVSCNPRFPILGYYLRIDPPVFERRQLDLNEEGGESPIVQTLPLPELERNSVFQVFIEVCISITCRQSVQRILRTTDVQTANIVFFENNIFMTCTFASNSDAEGCRFELELFDGNEPEIFFLPRSSASVSQCSQTLNQRRAYETITVSDVEANGAIGTQPIILDRDPPLNDTEAFTTLTGCTIPEPASRLSPGAIAGIVIAALIIAAAVLSVVIVILVYRVRTGQWFKLREKDAERLTVHFEKELLMGDDKPRRKPRVATFTRSGHDSPDHGTIVLADSAIPPKTGVEEQDAALPTNPDSAFTLDISSDRKKVKLHLNKALIRRVLQDKKLNTMDRKKPHRQLSIPKQHLLPLHCEVRVQVEDDDQS